MLSPEHHVRRDLLDRPVREYADNLQEQVYVVWRKLGVRNVPEFNRLLREKKVQPKDAERVRDLLCQLRVAVEKNQAPTAPTIRVTVPDLLRTHRRKLLGAMISGFSNESIYFNESNIREAIDAPPGDLKHMIISQTPDMKQSRDFSTGKPYLFMYRDEREPLDESMRKMESIQILSTPHSCWDRT